MKSAPLVYIITLNWNGYTYTRELLKSLKSLDYLNFTTVVIDNASDNNEADKINDEFPSTIVLKNNRNRGFVANNSGINLALKNKAKHILLLNNDTTVKKDFLKHLVDFIENNRKVGAVSPKILYYKKKKIWAMGGRLPIVGSIPRMIGQGRPSSSFNKIVEPHYLPGCGILLRSSAIKRAGAFNPVYFAYYEDTDLSFRLKRFGYKLKVIPESVIWHKVSKSTVQKKEGKYGKLQSFFLARNGLVFGKLNLRGMKLVVYIASQIIVKFPLYIALKVDSIESAHAYFTGLLEGCRFLLNGRVDFKVQAKYAK